MIVFLSSCTSYYQIYKATPCDNIVIKENALVYENDNCRVTYNLWGKGGNMGFNFYNKTEHIIYLRLDESFFVLNGIANNYFKNRVFTNSSSSSTPVSIITEQSQSESGDYYSDLVKSNKTTIKIKGQVASSGYSVSYKEENIVCIPPRTTKIISEYNINLTIYRDCDLFLHPTKSQIKTLSFLKDNSPFVFSNLIVYSIGQTGTPNKIKNEFYVNEITNYPEREVVKSKPMEFCGQKGDKTIKYFNNISPDKFYLDYSAESGVTMKH